MASTPPRDTQMMDDEMRRYDREGHEHEVPLSPEWRPERLSGVDRVSSREEEHEHRRESSDSSGPFSLHSPQLTISPSATQVAELFIFSYGVAVLWNFTPNQEKDLLADLTFSSMPTSTNGKASQKADAAAPTLTSLPLMTRPLDESDFETEDFHFEYDSTAEKPRIFNDMITLRTSDHMIKLAMSHAIAQSTKLSFFEERMQKTMTEAQYVPRRLALEGRLGMKRTEVVGLVGRLFEGRVDVNLCKCYTSHRRFHGEKNFDDLLTCTPSLQHARHPHLLLGQRTHSPPPLRRRTRVPRNQTAHPSPQRTLSSFPRFGRDPER